jgi:hypothetical protein
MGIKETKVTLMRKDSQGLAGTVANAEHHANDILPFIESMSGAVKHLGFKEWKQGHNVHEFITHDGRSFVLRPIVKDGENGEVHYFGLRLSMKLGRKMEDQHRLMDIGSISDVGRLLDMLHQLAGAEKGRLNTGEEARRARAAKAKA